MPKNSNYTDIMEKNHMEIPWHDYAKNDSNVLIAKAGLIEKASVIGRVGLIMLSCGTGAWRVRTSMNRLSKELGVTCTVDVGLMSIEFNCFDGTDCVSQSLSIANTGVNTSKLYRMEQFVDNFPKEEAHLTGEEIHRRLDQIEKIHTEETTALFYNNEQALRSLIKLAYFSYRDYYLKFEELPSGNGYADIVYFPKKTSNLPALVVEMKWDKSAEGAITQIKKRNYPAAIKDFGGEILLVGINYDKDAPVGERKHTCVIEKYQV